MILSLVIHIDREDIEVSKSNLVGTLQLQLIVLVVVMLMIR